MKYGFQRVESQCGSESISVRSCSGAYERHELVNVVVQRGFGRDDRRIGEIDQFLRNFHLVVDPVDVHPVLFDEQAAERVAGEQVDSRSDIFRTDAVLVDHAAVVVTVLAVQHDVTVECESAEVVQVGVVTPGGDEQFDSPGAQSFQRLYRRRGNPVGFETYQRAVDVEKYRFNHGRCVFAGRMPVFIWCGKDKEINFAAGFCRFTVADRLRNHAENELSYPYRPLPSCRGQR